MGCRGRARPSQRKINWERNFTPATAEPDRAIGRNKRRPNAWPRCWVSWTSERSERWRCLASPIMKPKRNDSERPRLTKPKFCSARHWHAGWLPRLDTMPVILNGPGRRMGRWGGREAAGSPIPGVLRSGCRSWGGIEHNSHCVWPGQARGWLTDKPRRAGTSTVACP